jgi:hypothetical protein
LVVVVGGCGGAYDACGACWCLWRNLRPLMCG